MFRLPNIRHILSSAPPPSATCSPGASSSAVSRHSSARPGRSDRCRCQSVGDTPSPADPRPTTPLPMALTPTMQTRCIVCGGKTRNPCIHLGMYTSPASTRGYQVIALSNPHPLIYPTQLTVHPLYMLATAQN
jgi:hypothetical protein